MASGTRFPYHRLGYGERSDGEARSYRRIMNFPRFRGFRIKRRRVKLGIPGLKMLLRKKGRLLSRMRVYWGKALKKLKNGGLINDLFGGNYLVMQFGPGFKGCPKPPNYGYSTGKFMEGPGPSKVPSLGYCGVSQTITLSFGTRGKIPVEGRRSETSQ